MPSLSFEWDFAKATSNRIKHKVSFDEASTSFDDAGAKIYDDEDHSVEEHREILIGKSILGRILIVSFTKRKHKFRLISARLASMRERRNYEKSQDSS